MIFLQTIKMIEKATKEADGSLSIVLIMAAIVLSGVVIYYLKTVAVKESKKIVVQFENLAKKLNLPLDITKQLGEDIFPRMEGIYEGRNIVIERTEEEKYNYFVVSISVNNPENLHWLVIPKNHLKEKDLLPATDLLLLGDAFFDKNFQVVGTDTEQIKSFLSNDLKRFLTTHEPINTAFNTFILFKNRLTFVLVSRPKPVKNDLILEVCRQFLYDLANKLEKNVERGNQ